MDIPSFFIRKLTHKWYVERDARRVAKSAAKESRSFGGFGGFAPKLRNSETPPSETTKSSAAKSKNAGSEVESRSNMKQRPETNYDVRMHWKKMK